MGTITIKDLRRLIFTTASWTAPHQDYTGLYHFTSNVTFIKKKNGVPFSMDSLPLSVKGETWVLIRHHSSTLALFQRRHCTSSTLCSSHWLLPLLQNHSKSLLINAWCCLVQKHKKYFKSFTNLGFPLIHLIIAVWIFFPLTIQVTVSPEMSCFNQMICVGVSARARNTHKNNR